MYKRQIQLYDTGICLRFKDHIAHIFSASRHHKIFAGQPGHAGPYGLPRLRCAQAFPDLLNFPGEVEEIRECLSAAQPWQPIGTSVPGLAGEYFMVSGSGKYMRNMILEPEANACIIELDLSLIHI